jgi:hypothetical protein
MSEANGASGNASGMTQLLLQQLPQLQWDAGVARPQQQLAVVLAAAIATFLVAHLIKQLARFLRIRRVLAPIPEAPGGQWLLGHVIQLLQMPKRGKGAWDLMCEWVQAKGHIVRFRLLNTQGVVVADPMACKRIFQQRFKVRGGAGGGFLVGPGGRAGWRRAGGGA